MAPDDVVEVEFGGVGAEEFGDAGAELVVAGHDVEGSAAGVFAVVVPAADVGDFGEVVAYGAVDADGAAGESTFAADSGAGFHGESECCGVVCGVVDEVFGGDPVVLAVDFDFSEFAVALPGGDDLAGGGEGAGDF